MKICIFQTMVEFGLSVEKKIKRLNGKYLVNRSGVGNNSNTINQPYGFLSPSLGTSSQSQKASSSTYTNNNNIYQVLIRKENNNNTNYKNSESR